MFYGKVPLLELRHGISISEQLDPRFKLLMSTVCDTHFTSNSLLDRETVYLQLGIVGTERVSSDLIQREYGLSGSTVIP